MKDLQEILIRMGHRAITEAPQEGWDKIISETETEIRAWAESCVPEKEAENLEKASGRYLQIRGYNKAIGETLTNLRKG